MVLTNKQTISVCELRDKVFKEKFWHRNAQLYCLGSNDKSKKFNKNYTLWKLFEYGVFSGPYLDTFHPVRGLGPGFFLISPLRSIVQVYNQICKRYMNENLIANANFRIRILNCRGGEVNFKKTTRCNSAKPGQVRKLVTWHWRIVMSEENRWLMLHFKKF